MNGIVTPELWYDSKRLKRNASRYRKPPITVTARLVTNNRVACSWKRDKRAAVNNKAYGINCITAGYSGRGGRKIGKTKITTPVARAVRVKLRGIKPSIAIAK